MKHVIYLVALFLMTGSCAPKTQENSSDSQLTQTQTQIQNLNAVEFKAKIESAKGTILDVRTPGEVAQGYIAEAVVLDMYRPDFTSKLAQLPKDKPVYVYCASGVRSIQTAQILQQNGFKEVYNLNKGIMDWYRNGFPVVR
jgi:rhodanese-related sulfurtransferase